jgi:hypothetical protein
METDRMQNIYRAIFTEMLTAQAAAVATFVDVSARCALQVGQQCQAVATPVAKTQPGGAAAGLTPHDDTAAIGRPLAPWPANFCRAAAGLPRVSMMSFLAHYDELRGRRCLTRD